MNRTSLQAGRARRWVLPALAGLLGAVWLARAADAPPKIPLAPAERLCAALDPAAFDKADDKLRRVFQSGQPPAALAQELAADPALVEDLLHYIQRRAPRWQSGFFTPLPGWEPWVHRDADNALKNTVTLQGITAVVPLRADGGWDWTWRGPNDDPEFAWFLNRQVDIPSLFLAWRETKDPRYRAALNNLLRDWVAHNPRPQHYSLSAQWRALEAARRAEDAWLPVLFAPEADRALDPDVVVGLLASMIDHAECLRDTHAPYGNHLLSEMGALAAVALAFPEFRDSPGWLEYALRTTHVELAKQFYPDGTQNELTNHYQIVALQSLQHLADVLHAAHRSRELVGLRPVLVDAWNYLAYVMSPRGEGPLNNDSDVNDNRSWLRDVVARYGRKDWLFLATSGKQGREPDSPPSRYFPWAAQAVMRDGWQGAAQWAFFNLGPYGSDHQHDHRLHLSVSAEGRDFLVDNGRYTYQPGPWREYFAGPTGHNIVLLDGRGPLRPPDVVTKEPSTRHEITAGLDFFSATVPYAGDWLTGQGPAYHQRAVLYARGQCWIVADRMLAAGGPRQLEALWHFHPDCHVRQDGGLVYTDDAKAGNLGLLAVNPPGAGWNVALVRGREGDAPQGWYSPYFNERKPATCAEFTATLAAPHTFAWVIWSEPAGRDIAAGRPQVEVVRDEPSRLSLRLRWPDGRVDEATVPFAAEVAANWSASPPGVRDDGK